MKKNKEYKKPAPKQFIPTELGSAVFASVDGRPTDRGYLVQDQQEQDGKNNGAGNSENID